MVTLSFPRTSVFGNKCCPAEVREGVKEAVRLEHPEWSAQQVEHKLLEEAPREYCVTKQDIRNQAMKLQRETFRQADDQAASTHKLLLGKYKDKVGLCSWHAILRQF